MITQPPTDEDLSSLSREQLVTEIQLLQQALRNQELSQEYLWNLFVEASLKLQLFSASVKAGVTSLLDYSIFWDRSTEHEFLNSINAGNDEVTKLVTLLALAFRVKAARLEIKVEQQDLREILSSLRDQLSRATQPTHLEIQFPPGEAIVNVDFEYLALALRLLLEADAEIHAKDKTIKIIVEAGKDAWILNISGISAEVMELFHLFPLSHQSAARESADAFAADRKLRLLLVEHFFSLQHIEVRSWVKLPDGLSQLCLAIPVE